MSDTGEGSTKRMVPLREGIFRLPNTPEGKPVLVGSRCPKCGAHYFPRRQICIACGQNGLDEADLSTRGKVWTYTIAGQTPPGSLVEAPYALAVVELPEKVAVRTVLTDVDLDAVKVGMDVEITLAKMKEDEDGNDVMSYKFKPV
ncbi:MAG TPA: Zn-ribbon domain-containing OB-fold protein [Dehalococcoidia bacterium]|nr:Zn-ribbon domain-containing OB-fold protein [Dehalococcoidia bacterium]